MTADDMDQHPFTMLDFFSEPNKNVRESAAKQSSVPVPLSLKARQTSALSLKHIFDQILSSTNRSYAVEPDGVQASSNNVAASSLQDNFVSYKEKHPNYLPEFDKIAMRSSQSNTIISPSIFPHNAYGKTCLSVSTELLPQPVHRCEQSGPSNAQMTIFYSGTVNVYDNVPVDKANAIILLAQSGKPSPNITCRGKKDENDINLAPTPLNATGTAAGFSMLGTFTNSVPNTITISSPFDSFLSEAMLPSVSTRSIGELPYPRKASLTRFLEKRKERMNSKFHQMEHQKNGELGMDGNNSNSKKPCISMSLSSTD